MMNVQAITDLAIRGSPQRPASAPAPPVGQPVALPQPPAEQPREREPSPREVAQAAEGVNAFLKANGSHIQFALHEKANQLMVEVVDNRTQEVIKTFPPKELLDLAAKIGELVGTLLDERG